MSSKLPEKTRLEELSNELPERERKDLLEKITRKMRPEDRADFTVVELEQEERDRLIDEELHRLSGWHRFVLWLRGLLTGRSRKELLLRHKISRIKSRIRQGHSGLTGFESRDLTPRFAHHLFDLYAAVHPLLGLFRAFHTRPEFQKEAVVRLVESRYLKSRNSVEELVPIEDLEEIFSRTGSEEELRKQVLRGFNEYLNKIPAELFEELAGGIEPFFLLKNIVLFPYAAMFRHFGYGLTGDRLDDKYPYFHHAPVMLMLDLMERLYCGLYLSLKLEKNWRVHEEILRFHCRQAWGGEAAADTLNQEVSELARALSRLVQQAGEFADRVPIMELIRYFRQDPYYRLMFNVPRYNLRAVFTAAARAGFLAQLDERLPALKERVIDRKLQELFRGARQLSLFYYLPDPGPGGPGFAHTRSLAALYNFLVQIYKGGIQDAARLASAYLLANNRIAQNRLVQLTSSLDELEARIVLFDRSLSPDEDDGKALARFRRDRVGDLEEQRMYRLFLAQKNREARELINSGRENLLGIKKCFVDQLTSPVESVKSALRTLNAQRGRSETLQQILKGSSDQITDFYGLLDQLLALEKGS